MSSRRHSLSGPPPQLSGTASTHELRQRVITCLNKLSDRDTLAGASLELESIARTLSHDSFSSFLSCIHNTDSSSKSPVRKQCVNLLSLLSRFHGDALSPFISKMIATVLRRLRDPDSVVRSACVDAVAEMSSRITRPSFSVAFLRPFMDALALEQDVNVQIGASLCLAAAIDAAPEPDVESLRRTTLPRLGKLLKTDSCKAKAPLLVLIGSVVSVGGASSRGVMNWLVPCVVEFLGSEDWNVRKASVEVLGKVASVEKDLASQHKVLCLDSLQNKRFDKVKVVRETMNLALDMWKEVKDVSENAPTPVKSPCVSVGTEDGKGLYAAKSSPSVGSKLSQLNKMVPSKRSPPSTVSFKSSGKREIPIKGNDKYSRMGALRQQDHEKLSVENLQTPISKSSHSNMTKEEDIKRCDFESSKSPTYQNVTNSKADVKQVFLNKMSDEKVRKIGGSNSRVVPCDDDDDLNTVVTVNNVNEVCESPQDVEDLSLIREQLLQIENQQSNLLDLLQRFIGTSQTGMNSLETRVHGLEMALDEISYDLAVSSGRIPNTDAIEDMCCKLPGTDFLSSKFWKKTEGRYSTTSRLSFGSSAPINNVHNATDRNGSKEILTTNSKRFQHRRDEGGYLVNPLPEIQSDLNGHSGQLSYKISKNFVQDAGSAQGNSFRRFDGISSTREILRNQNIRSSA
ncbi:TORTIFOLIA1-like protein 4 [Vicia villosa]|uniref:TORTIFOLIA1-like protein 4 n=1 Tax=Vicia villosa TaxID=3911 RepID=UPI00273C4F61|nr:TORTIFOLIA1-like protein 4 [Vicia villosa]